MTYLFNCRDGGDVLMLKPDGDALLRIIGRAPVPQGIIDTAALHAAISAIEAAISQESRRSPQRAPPATAEDPPLSDAHPADRGIAPAPVEIGLRQRARPLLRMLRLAQAAGARVTWRV